MNRMFIIINASRGYPVDHCGHDFELKGQFASVFFHESTSPKPLQITLESM
jgi:hypothetical protein